LGAGRLRQDDVIDSSAGFVLFKKTGDAIAAGETIARVYARDEQKLRDGMEQMRRCIEIGSTHGAFVSNDPRGTLLLDEWSSSEA
jgi:pyrimidine-nucleoside phosphorylase